MTEIIAGAAKADITPSGSVHMDGMIREHRSTGVHDPLHARALFLAPAAGPGEGVCVISLEVCGLRRQDSGEIAAAVARETGLSAGRVVVASTHTHSGPATVGYFSPRETGYVEWMASRAVECAARARREARPAAAGWGRGREETISHYRRLLSDDGRVIMNWEPFPAGKIVRVLGESDPEVGVIRVVDAADAARPIAVLFCHPGHPNIMSGDNYLISADYPGRASQLLEEAGAGVALFLNGAQGSVDIDGRKDRDWAGVERAARALAGAVSAVLPGVKADRELDFGLERVVYDVPTRRISEAEQTWAGEILARTGGRIQAMADGVGDDYLATLYSRLHADAEKPVEIEQIAFRAGDCALVSFPGELFTEIGLAIRRESPFAGTYLVGLANGKVGYVPTLRAISEGGYAVRTRMLADTAGETVLEQSRRLLYRLAGRPE